MKKTVSFYMTQDPIFVNENTPVQQVIQVFNDHNFNHLIVNKPNGTIAGVISKEDLLQNLYGVVKSTTGRTYTSKILTTEEAENFMTTELMTVKPSDTIDYAIELLLQKRFRCLPVVENNKAVGIITSFDLLKGYYQEFG